MPEWGFFLVTVRGGSLHCSTNPVNVEELRWSFALLRPKAEVASQALFPFPLNGRMMSVRTC